MFFIDYLLVIALCQGFILAFFLLTSKYYKSTANYWLALGLILISTTSLLDIIGGNFVIKSLIVEFFINDWCLEFLIYIPFYYYFKISSEELISKKGYYLLLTLPFFFDTLINIFIVANFTNEEITKSSNIQFFYLIESIAAIGYSLFLCLKAYKVLSRILKNDKIKEWLFKIWKSTLILIITWAVMSVLHDINNELSFLITLLYITVSVWLFWIIYNGVVNMNLIIDRVAIHKKIHSKDVSDEVASIFISETYGNEIIKDIDNEKKSEKLNLHFEKINKLVHEENLFLNEDLGIEDVAKKIGFSSGYVSQIIKNSTNKNFTNWINDFRVSKVKEMLLNQEFDNYTALAIGLEAGFKSKSSFYATFKKSTGITPANFRKTKS